jgi:hypothetical protein
MFRRKEKIFPEVWFSIYLTNASSFKCTRARPREM